MGPMVQAHIVESTMEPGTLSMRLDAKDRTFTRLRRALQAAGFEPGDVVTIRRAGDEPRASLLTGAIL